MNEQYMKKGCQWPKMSFLLKAIKVKDFFKQTDLCHEEMHKEIEQMKTTINGEDYWMTNHDYKGK